MKTKLSFLIAIFLLLFSASTHADKVVVPITDDGAWSINNHPAAVYHNGKSFFSWITKSGALRISSYDEVTDEIQTATIAGGYGSEDFAAPSLLIRASGQILVFASKNQAENNMQIYRSNSTTGDITEGFEVSNLTGYGISQTLPFAIDNHIIVFWRSKNNLGYTYYANANNETSTGGFSAGGTTRTGFLGDGGFGNTYQWRDEVPVMRATQDDDGAIHMVITQLGTGLKFSNSTIHYLKGVLNTADNRPAFYKASGDPATGISYASPPDVVYATSQASDKVIAYDITIIDGKPTILYDAFNGNNVNAASNPGETSNHTYKVAQWDGTQWVSNTIAEVDDGLEISQYSAVGGRTFLANSYQNGGLSFAANNSYAVYLSKKESTGAFELYHYESTDQGATWSQTEALTSGSASDVVNMRPVQVKNAPAQHSVDVLWMQGNYSSPKDFSTSVVARGEAMPVSSIQFNESEYYTVVEDEIDLNIQFAPLFVANREFTLESSDPSIAKVTAEGKIKAVDVGTVTITAKATSNPSITASTTLIVEAESVYEKMMQRIVDEAFSERISSVANLDAKVAANLSNLQSNGSFPGINYKATDRTDWPPMEHLNKMIEMALGYVYEGSNYYQDATLKQKLDLMLSYWQSQSPNSNNWYQNEIGEPQRMGLFLILVQHVGAEKLNETYYNNAINRMRNKGGNPGAQAGANRVDVALHWVYRACLTEDRELLQTGLDYIYGPLVYTSGSEGIQYDNSFTQHGRQLHIGAYGDAFMDGITKAASYASETPFALPNEQLEILSSFVKDTYISVLRGSNIFFNAIGRSSTRPGATGKNGSAIIERMKLIDSDNEIVYENALLRLKGEELPSYGVSPKSTHFFKSDYTVHQRPEYSVDLRMVSTRTARNEYLKDNGEGIKQYFLSDGATGIFVDGNEYYNIMPVWNWAKIPGTTTAELPEIPQANSYILSGASSLVGGVSDSIYSASVYQYIDSYAGTNYSGTSSSSAKKAYFFFDNEVVLLGNSINSNSEYKVNTTVNQTLLKGDVTISSNGSQTTLANGAYNYNNNLDWVYHNKVAYFFPEKGKIDLSAQPQSGKWTDINTSYTQEGTVTEDVFSLSLDHGVKPIDGEYTYIIVPGISGVAEAQAYNQNDIEIIANTDSVQAVYHKSLKVLQAVFYKGAILETENAILVADGPLAVLIKDIDKANPMVHLADPTNSNNSRKLGLLTNKLSEAKLLTYQANAPYQGGSLAFVVDENTPTFTGRDVLLDRSGWTIRTSSVGPADTAVAPERDKPEYIIDGDNVTSFLFVKPGKTFTDVSVPAGASVWFELDMKKVNEMTYLVYRHRDYNNTTTPLRASKGSFYGKVNEADDYQAISENFTIATGSTEVRIDLPEKVAYRYVKFVIEEWDTASGNTIQVSEFNIGNNVSLDLGTGIEEMATVLTMNLATLYPNPVKAGEDIHIVLSDKLKDAVVNVYSLSGVQVGQYKAVGTNASLTIANQGVYILDIQKEAYSVRLKAVVN